MIERPPMIRTDESNAFANDTMRRRVPDIIRETLALNPDYAPRIQLALLQLLEDIEGDERIWLVDLLSPDYETWSFSYNARPGATWQNVDWFFAETFFYRRLIECVRYFETGRDPFAPKKVVEIGGTELWRLLDSVLALRENPMAERLSDLLYADLWGNRIDLSFANSLAHGGVGTSADLLVDNVPSAVDHLLKIEGVIRIIADNTGTELALDFALADALLDNPETSITFHLKMHPTFVSDATVTDAHALLAAMEAHGGAAAAMAKRLQTAFTDKRLRFLPDFFWNSAYLLWDMPKRLKRVFAGASLTIIKGDANYRRMVGDAFWPAETPFAAVVDYFPSPLLALRTLKSDPLVGLPLGLASKLDGEDATWRSNGRRGVIQFRR